MRGHEREEIIRRRITASLDRFARSRQGDFSFLVSPQPPRVIDGRDIAPETLDCGVDVLELLLELAGGDGQPAPVAPPDGADAWLT
jgi:hypothetical protein